MPYVDTTNASYCELLLI